MTTLSALSPFSKSRVAIFIDGDHIPPSYRGTIADEAARLGETISTQLFCDLSARPDWAHETGIDVTHCKGRPGKNCADMTLCIAALDMAYRGLATAFLIASNDRDFEPLTRHLIRLGFTARQLRSPAQPVTSPKPAEPSSPTQKTHGKVPLLNLVRSAIMAHGGPDGIRITALNPLLHRQGVIISNEPEKTWRAWLGARPSHFTCDPKGPEAKVRLIDAPPPLTPHTAP